MKPGCTLFFLLCSALTVTTTAHAQTPDTATTAPYLLAGAPTFDLSISQFREDFNSQNPSLPLNEFRAIDSSPDKANLTRAASKINENLYASTALERGTLKIKTQSQKKLQSLLTAGKNKRYYTETEGALRYVVADNGEKGLTFAVEPIKLALSESLEGLNK